MHDKRLEERLDALAAPQRDARPPAHLRAAVRSARHHRLASASLLASLLLASGVLVVVAMRSGDRAPIIEIDTPPIVQHQAGLNAQSVAALRDFDPFGDAEFPGERAFPGVTIQPVRLLPLTVERLDRILQGEL